MKQISLALLLCFASLYSQHKPDTPIQTVERIFNQYVAFSEGTDSKENKDAMTDALMALQKSSDQRDLPLLIDVWMYYDPTDFPVRNFVEPVFNKDKSAALHAIDERLKHKRPSEEKDLAPYADLLELKRRLSN
jgi:hypothetical protein